MNLTKLKIGTKPKYEKLKHEIDFFDLFCRLEQKYDNCFLFESLGPNQDGSRYSVLGFGAETIISARGNKLTIGDKTYSVNNPYKALEEVFPDAIIAKDYAGGLVGFMSFESINYFEDSLKLKTHPDFEEFKFGFYSDGLIFDNITGETIYFYYENSRLDMLQDLAKLQTKQKITNPKVIFEGHSLSKTEHAKIVAEVKEEIMKGNTFQCEVGFKSKYKIKGSALPIYAKLREINPSPYMYYMKFDDQKIIGASPELLIKLKNNELETYPLAGTVKRGKTKEMDMFLARKLLNDKKEQAEHKMLVDLHRNDLGKVSQFGTVKIRRYMEIKKFSHVQHISSEISGILRDGENMFSALKALMPAGTLSGAPKIESIKLISQNEKEPRGPYGGAVGHFGFNGDCTFAIPIRTLFIKGESGYAQTCGGIVYDSTSANEYKEIENKLAAMKTALADFLTK
jgi:anthranilate synthase component 1